PVDLWPAVGKIKAPTLIVRGSESDVFSPETAKRMLELIPGSQLVEIPGAGHSVPAEAPEVFERAVRQFLGAGTCCRGAANLNRSWRAWPPALTLPSPPPGARGSSPLPHPDPLPLRGEGIVPSPSLRERAG